MKSFLLRYSIMSSMIFTLMFGGCIVKSKSHPEKTINIAGEEQDQIGIIELTLNNDDQASVFMLLRCPFGIIDALKQMEINMRSAFGFSKECKAFGDYVTEDKLALVKQIVQKDIDWIKQNNLKIQDKVLRNIIRPRTKHLIENESIETVFSSTLSEIDDPNSLTTMSTEDAFKTMLYIKEVFKEANSIKSIDSYDHLALFAFVWDHGIYGMLVTRCRHYLPDYVKFTPAMLVNFGFYECTRAAKKMVEILDPIYFNASTAIRGYVVYLQHTLDLMYSSKTTPFLDGLLVDMEDEANFNLWESVKKNTISKDQALEFMTILFQNIKFRSHVSFLSFYPVPQEHKEIYYTNYEKLKLVFDFVSANSNAARIIDIYDVDPADERFYHYFTPLYLAKRLKEDGIKDKWAAFLPHVFNTVYEYYKEINSGMKYAEIIHFSTLLNDDINKSEKLWAELNLKYIKHKRMISDFNDPKSMDLADDPGTLEDLYMGYIGSLQGIGRDDLILDIEAYKQQFFPNPRQFMINFRDSL